jgi:hypothetical protein
MDFIINENQLRAILREQDESKMTNYMKRLYSFTKEVVNRVSKKYDLNVKMFLTWGTSVGGLILPLDNFIRNGSFNVTDDQRYLILAGIASILFFNNKKTTKELIKKIDEEGLKNTFNIVLKKSEELEEAFVGFLNGIKISVGTFLDTVAYAFLIPIITDIQHYISNSSDPRETGKIILERLIASGIVVMGAETLSALIAKLIRKFK